MMNIALSQAAVGLLRALIDRPGAPRGRILLSEWRSVDWQSLTFIGERHDIRLRICGPDCAAVAARLTAGLEDAEFAIAGHVVADIALVAKPETSEDGSIALAIEALTIADELAE